MIALVGDAYGSEPPKETHPADRPCQSYTQWEYAFAMGERFDGSHAHRKAVHVCICSQNYLDTHPVEQKKVHANLQIDEAIHQYGKFLLVLSEASTNSKCVNTEIRRAWLAGQRDGTRKLFPIRLVDYSHIVSGYRVIDRYNVAPPMCVG